MKHDHDPRHLNLTALARERGELALAEHLGDFERLLQESGGLGTERPVRFSAHAEMRPDASGAEQVWLRLRADAVLPLVCQRCLGPADIAVEVDRWLRFVATEEQAAAEDDASEEDVLVLSRAFDLLQLVEDEILMALPVAPMHGVCPQPVKLQAVDPDFVDAPEPKAHPFAVLEQFKKNRTQ
ncbi:MAG: DUF177 domain-containing protein [Burkholderiales bacterium]|nr:DUF177 domain-containing protein [Burkholderiales bacterium]